MAKKGTAASILLILLALVILALALSGNASLLLRKLLEWLAGLGKAGPPGWQSKNGTASGGGSGTTVPAPQTVPAPSPAPAPAPSYSGPAPAPGTIYGPPAPAPVQKNTDPKTQMPAPAPGMNSTTVWESIAATAGAIGAWAKSIGGELPGIIESIPPIP